MRKMIHVRIGFVNVVSLMTNRPYLAVHTWKYRFTSECMSVVHDQAFGAKTPSYTTVLQLDRKLRAFPVPPNLQVPGFGNSASSSELCRNQDSVSLMLQRHIVLAIREMSEYIVTPELPTSQPHSAPEADVFFHIRSSLPPPKFLCTGTHRSPEGPPW